MSVTLDESSAVASHGKTERLFFVDVLRVSIVVFVIVRHSAQAYGPTGGMWPVHDQAQSDWFRPFYTVNSAFDLGLLFLLAGYFVPSSYERKGPGRFLRERWVRIGVPLVSFALLIHLPRGISSCLAPGARRVHSQPIRRWLATHLPAPLVRRASPVNLRSFSGNRRCCCFEMPYDNGRGTHSGTVAAASVWGGPMEVKTVRPSLLNSYERLYHATGLARFMLGFARSRRFMRPKRSWQGTP
jgi:Erythromycin esterase/Acyltransferase family